MTSRRMNWFFGPIAVFVAASAALADGLIVVHDPPPVSRPHYRFAPLEVQYHYVTVDIADQVATTEVDQAFFNPNNQQLEGTYIFPLPIGAEIDRFSMDIGGKLVEAELLDAEKARRIYEDIVRKARDPALLEYAGQGMLKARVFPIEPHSEKRIRLRYTQLLRNDSGLVQYVYPLNTEKFSAAPVKNVSIKVDVECAAGIRSVYSPSHPVDVKRGGERSATVGFEATNTRPDTDFQLLFAPGGDDVGLSLLTYADGLDSDGGYFLLLASPAAKLSTEIIAEKDIVFVLDTSGSMADRNKLDQAKKALRFCLKNLNAGDRFEIVRFSTETEPLFNELSAASAKNIARAEDFVAGLKPIGGTAIEPALVAALKPAVKMDRNRPYFVVFLTDGQPTVGATNVDEILSSVARTLGDRAIRIFSFGIGTDINTHLLDRLAEKTRGASTYVLPDEDIELKVSSFYSKISQPVLANLNLKFSGDIRPANMYPRELPDLFMGEQVVLFGRYRGAGDSTVTLSGTVNGRERTFTYDTRFGRSAGEHRFIPRLWATRRVGYLLDEIRLRGESAELRDEVTQLARRYGIVTPYTAYLIVEDESRRNIPLSSRTLQQIDRDDQLRARVGYIVKNSARESGGGAVGGAQALGALKDAATPAAPAAANELAERGFALDGSGDDVAAQKQVSAQQTRYVAGRAFFQNGEQWIDAGAQSRANARRTQIKFGSDDYFALMTRHRDAAQWLALGRNVQLLLDDTVYEIVD